MMKEMAPKITAEYPAGGMREEDVGDGANQINVLGDTPMGNMGPNGDNPAVGHEPMGEPHMLSGQMAGKPSTSADPYPAKPGC